MKQVILDTSFIISCVKQKIDFFEKLEHDGFQVFVPSQTIDELMGLGAQLSLNILGKQKFNLVNISGRDADAAIISFAKKNPQSIVATLDVELQKKLKNQKMIIRGKKRIEII